MSNDPVDGGTVRYHRVEYLCDVSYPWLVWFTEDQADPYWFTAEQGEAMGLTPPEPAPLVVTCNGHSIELSDEQAEWYSTDWKGTVDHSPHGSCATKLAGLLRDARQDPQPAPATAPVSPYEGLRAVLAVRDDADELIAHAAASWYDHPGPRPNWWQVLRGAVGDAARSGGAK